MNSIKRGDIWYVANSYAAVGSEQRAGRPAIIVSNDQNNRFSSTVEVVYLTTQPKRDLPTHVTIRSISRESTALCEQVTSVAVERVGDYVCHISDSEMAAIEDAMLVSLGIEAGEQVAACEETPPRTRPEACGGRSAVYGVAADVRCFVGQAAEGRMKEKARVA